MNKTLSVEIMREEIVEHVLSQYDDNGANIDIEREDLFKVLEAIVKSDMEVSVNVELDASIYSYGSVCK